MDLRRKVECGSCLKQFHLVCLGAELPRRGPYYCAPCYEGLKLKGSRDLTLDRELMDYIYEGVIPDSIDSRERCERASRWLSTNEYGDLIIKENTGQVREVPVVGKR